MNKLIISMSDPLENGIEEMLIESQIVTSQNKTKNIFVNNKLHNIDELKRKYNRVLIICLANHANSDIYDILTSEIYEYQLQTIKESLSVLTCSASILSNNKHLLSTCIVKSSELLQFVHTNIRLNETELIIPMFELKLNVARNYIKLYNIDCNYEELFQMILLQSYYNCDDKISTKYNTIMIMKFLQLGYWNNHDNLIKNVTRHFVNRVLFYKNVPQFSNTFKIQHDHPYDFEDRKYETCLGYNYSLMYTKPQIQKNTITDLLYTITDKTFRFSLFKMLLLSREYCDTVINNKQVLTLMKEDIRENQEVIRYIMGYTWAYMYMEETKINTKSTQEDRHIFDIDTAHLLPTYMYTEDNIHYNPYLQLYINEDCDFTIFGGLKMIENYPYGVDTLEGFKKKFNLFTTGNIDKNIFDGLNWGSFAVSGSLIPACVPIRHPMIDILCKKETSYDDGFMKFCEHYYGNSDIDLMNNKTNVYDFFDDIIDILVPCLQRNLGTTELELKSVNSLHVIIHEDYIINNRVLFEELTGMEIKTENFSKLLANENLQEYFYEIYTRTKLLRNEIDNQKYGNKNFLYENYREIIQIDQLNMRIVDYPLYTESPSIYELCDKNNNVLVKISNGAKVKISSTGMIRPIEAFMLNNGNTEFFTCVGRFHLPCVRGYYNGDNVYLFPSCITAMMTYINLDYRYFHGSVHPYDILRKYRFRGYGILLNKMEIQSLKKYFKDEELELGLLGLNSLSLKMIDWKEEYTNYEFTYCESSKCNKRIGNTINKNGDMNLLNLDVLSGSDEL
jgi:hypothetical protein